MYIKITPQGVFWTRRVLFGQNRLKNADFKILAIFGPLPPLEKFDVWLPDDYAWKGWKSSQCVRKPPLGHFLGIPRDQCEEIAQRRSSEKAVRTSNSLSDRNFYIKITPKGFSGHAELPGDRNDFKIWPFMAIFPLSPPLEKFDFWLPNNYAWQGCQSNQCFQKHWGTF